MNKKISIVIPVYNSQKYLKKCVESILEQTYANFEAIFVNDGSTDNSLKILESYKDNRLKILSRENKGQLQSRIDGVKMASGEYIMFLDSDDWIDINMLEVMTSKNEKYCADIVRCEFYDEHLKENRSVRNSFGFKEDKFVSNDILKDVYPMFFNNYMLNAMWGQLIKKELIKEFYFDKNIRFGEDLLFNLELYKNINTILFVTKPFYHYRISETSITQVKEIEIIKRKIVDTVSVYKKCYDNAIELNIDSEENTKSIFNIMLDKLNSSIIDLFKFRTSKKQKLEMCIYSTKVCDENHVFENVKIKNLTFRNRCLIKKNYNILLFINFLDIIFIYNIKSIIKKILVLINHNNT